MKKTEPRVIIGIEKYGQNLLGLGAAHTLALKIQAGQERNPKLVKILR